MSFEDLSNRPFSDDQECQAASGASADPDPPDELLEEMALAAEVYERLAARGRELRFRLDPPTGRVTVGVHDASGELLYTILPSRALEIAGGEDVDDV